MDTHGHHECAEDAGLPLIEAGLRRAGKEHWRTGAFYLGNWITDVQQAVDPGPYDSVAAGVRSGVQGVIDAINSLEHNGLPNFIRDQFARPFADFLRRIQAATSALEGGQQSRVAKSLKKAFLVGGYFKFVHPEEKGLKARMDYHAFKHVYTTCFTQYYPHEHLDRPARTVGSKTVYETAVEESTTTPDRRGTGSKPLSPHIYKFLKQDIQIAAGLIAQLDRDWAKRTFSKTGQPWPDADADKDWNLGLARLGHAVHALEDYFAHSNFVEHALKAKEKTITGGHPGEVFSKRLQKLNGDGSVGGPEPHVVTGYFDSWDTLHSLSHVAQELGLRVEAHRDRAPEPPEVHGKGPKVGRLMVELVRAIKKGPKTRAAVQAELMALASGKDPSVDAAIRDAAKAVLHEIPPEASEIKDAFADTVLAFAETVPGSSLTVVEALIMLAEFHENLMYPWKFFTWMVTELPPGAARWIVENIGDAIEDFVKGPFETAVRRIIENKLGRFRVGSHSLLAKDYEWPGESEINATHTHAINLAKAVHWYVVKTLLRHADPPAAPVTRGAHEEQDDKTKSVNTLGAYTWIDWLELCETFLRHPAGNHPSRPKTPIASRWWSPILDGKAFTKFPGFSATRPGRDLRLPHALIYLSAADLDKQINDADKLRKQLENEYNGVKPKPQKPAPAPPPPSGKVSQLQRLLGVAETDAWNPETEDAARAHMVRYGSRGPLVEWTQSQLNSHGMDSGTVDGIAGEITTGAIRRWQSSKGLAVDGVAGPKTLRSLAEA
jgi:hypothetical protein